MYSCSSLELITKATNYASVLSYGSRVMTLVIH